MHIGLSLMDLALGGAQVFFVQLAEELAKRGHDVSYWLDPRSRGPTHRHPALVSSLDRVAEPIPRSLLLRRADVIHLDGYHGIRRKLFYLPRFGRCLETYHSTYSVRRAGPLYPPHRVAVSEAVSKRLSRVTCVIPYGVRAPVLSSPVEKRYDVAIVGRIHPVKDHRLFLDVCSEIHRLRGRCAALLLAGHRDGGDYQHEIDEVIARRRAEGVDIHVAFDVAPHAVFDWLRRVRVLLVTSREEGFGRMAIEGMACELPVVAKAVGGLREIVTPNETGFLVDDAKAADLVVPTLCLLADEALRSAMGARGRAVVQKMFSMERMVAAYEAVYAAIAR